MKASDAYKPTIENIILTLLIFAWMPLLIIDTGIRCITVPCNSTITISFATYMIQNTPQILGVNYVYFILTLAVSYALAIIITQIHKQLIHD